MSTKNEPCCGEHAQPIPTKGHPHAMHFVMLLAGMGLIYSVAGVILLTKISNAQAAVTAPVVASATAPTAPPTPVIVPNHTTTSVEVKSPTVTSVEVK